MSYFFTPQDGYYELTRAGSVACAVIAVVIFLAATIVGSRIAEKTDSKEKASIFSVRQLVFSAVAIALAYALSYVKLIHMPWGGSVTLCSMLFVCLIGYWYGPRIGIVCAFTYGMLQFIQGGGSYILSPLQVGLDYILAFTALGFSGLFSKAKNGLVIGYIVAVVARGLIHAWGGYLYWMDYMPEEFPKALSVIYPICYNFAYIGLEAVITVALICIKPVRNALEKIKGMAEGNAR